MGSKHVHDINDHDDIPEHLTPEQLLRMIARSLRRIEGLDPTSREEQLTILPTTPLMSTSDAVPVTTVNQKWNVPANFRVKYFVVMADNATWFTLQNGPRSDGPYRAVNGTSYLDLPDSILGGNELQITNILTASTIVRMLVVGAYND